jgi:hypothetical protein
MFDFVRRQCLALLPPNVTAAPSDCSEEVRNGAPIHGVEGLGCAAPFFPPSRLCIASPHELWMTPTLPPHCPLKTARECTAALTADCSLVPRATTLPPLKHAVYPPTHPLTLILRDRLCNALSCWRPRPQQTATTERHTAATAVVQFFLFFIERFSLISFSKNIALPLLLTRKESFFEKKQSKERFFCSLIFFLIFLRREIAHRSSEPQHRPWILSCMTDRIHQHAASRCPQVLAGMADLCLGEAQGLVALRARAKGNDGALVSSLCCEAAARLGAAAAALAGAAPRGVAAKAVKFSEYQAAAFRALACSSAGGSVCRFAVPGAGSTGAGGSVCPSAFRPTAWSGVHASVRLCARPSVCPSA